MTDQLLSTTNDEPTALIPNATSSDGNAAYSDNEYPSETESEKPVILELGTSPNPALITNAYSAEYPLDMHLSANANTYLTQLQSYPTTSEHHSQSQTITSLAPHLPLYNSSYGHHALATTTATSSSITHAGAVSLHTSGGYSPHIPQTVSTWPISNPDAKGNSDIVPPPIYISYVGAREHVIAKETNPSWKEKALQIEKDYKKTACDRERTRMRDMNRAFDLLRSKLPISKPNGKKYSKIESLRIAITYINHLQRCLKENPPNLTQDSQQTNVTDYTAELDSCPASSDFQYESRKTVYKDIEKELDETHSGAWSDNSYLSNGQDQWD